VATGRAVPLMPPPTIRTIVTPVEPKVIEDKVATLSLS
jgi:hypothetical protein